MPDLSTEQLTPQPAPQRTRATDGEMEAQLLVRRMTWEAEGVLSLELVHPNGQELPTWEPGAHIDVHTGGQVRQYSLCGDPQDRRSYRVAVLNEPSSRGGSAHIHRHVRPGELLDVKGPRNRFPLVEAPDYLLIAGGIGITPLLAMARALAKRGARWQLVYGGRQRASMAFAEELQTLQGLGPEARTATTEGVEDSSDAGSSRVSLWPQDEHGLLDLAGILAGVDQRTLVYCCGPEALIAAVEERCAILGLDDRLHTERFAAVTVAPPPGGESGFEVEAVRSGQIVQVGPDESIVDALESAGVSVETSCRDGICGTCETKVLDGTPDHRDMLLSPAEHESGQSMMICVSRCASPRLALDL